MKAILKQKHEGLKSLSSHTTIVERRKTGYQCTNNDNRSQN